MLFISRKTLAKAVLVIRGAVVTPVVVLIREVRIVEVTHSRTLSLRSCFRYLCQPKGE